MLLEQHSFSYYLLMFVRFRPVITLDGVLVRLRVRRKIIDYDNK